MPVKLILFDCDGTLVDSQNVIVNAMLRAYEAMGMTPPSRQKMLSVVGLSLVKAMHRLGDDAAGYPAEELAEHYKVAFHAQRAEPGFEEPLFPGIGGMLEILCGREDVLLGLATGKSQRGVAAVLAHHGLEGRFVTIQTADTAPSKPHPGMVLQAMEETGIGPQDTVLIGDTSYDMVMARSADAHAVGVTWGYHPRDLLRQSGAQHLVDAADELLPLLDEMWGRG
ncbi:HAD-IA family hydrolase [Ancylobacter sp. 6x-1]|uniref:HAD-IA family hydrolase n=1 Tax=Ancylobacter crimeensis TaxID=2579147 RepID=A0ABT0D6N6_9HYPH|nr:HAD-IA family hydrolase [Ancylobacter crimeensis]MCK0195588.1 HAD-IA family hydrolase [Ancylobacter crimeensis]